MRLGLLRLLLHHLELEVGARHVARAAHRDHPAAGLDARVERRRELVLLVRLAHVDRERELVEAHRIVGAQRIDVARLALDPRQHLDVAEDDAARAARRDGVDARAVGAAVDPLEQRRLVARAHRVAVLGGGLAALDHLAFDEDAIRLEREAGDGRGLGDGEPVPTFDRLTAGVREGLVDLGLGDAFSNDGLHHLLRDAELLRRCASGRVGIEPVEATGTAAGEARAALIAHAAGPVVPEGDRADLGLGVTAGLALFARADLDATARRREDREAARDVDRDRVTVAFDADARVGGGDAVFAGLDRERLAFDAGRVEPDFTRLERHAAVEEDDLRVPPEEDACTFARANQRACSFAGVHRRAARERRAADRLRGAGRFLHRDLTGGEVEPSADTPRFRGRLRLERDEEDDRDRREQRDERDENCAVGDAALGDGSGGGLLDRRKAVGGLRHRLRGDEARRHPVGHLDVRCGLLVCGARLVHEPSNGELRPT